MLFVILATHSALSLCKRPSEGQESIVIHISMLVITICIYINIHFCPATVYLIFN